MPRVSKKENKSVYQLLREEKGLSREKASEMLEFITPERLERIENNKFDARPDEIMMMAKKIQCTGALQLLLFQGMCHRTSLCAGGAGKGLIADCTGDAGILNGCRKVQGPSD